jgi:hypothetical protein
VKVGAGGEPDGTLKVGIGRVKLGGAPLGGGGREKLPLGRCLFST